MSTCPPWSPVTLLDWVQLVPSYSAALPQLSTATQKLDETHETASEPPASVGWNWTGADQVEPSKTVARLDAVARQNVDDTQLIAPDSQQRQVA